MNKEQKAFIDNLVKNNGGKLPTTCHGQPGSMEEKVKNTIRQTKLKDLDYKKIVYDYIAPTNRITKNKVLDMLLDIKEKGDFTEYNNWVRENKSNGSFKRPNSPNYTNRLVDVGYTGYYGAFACVA